MRYKILLILGLCIIIMSSFVSAEIDWSNDLVEGWHFTDCSPIGVRGTGLLDSTGQPDNTTDKNSVSNKACYFDGTNDEYTINMLTLNESGNVLRFADWTSCAWSKQIGSSGKMFTFSDRYGGLSEYGGFFLRLLSGQWYASVSGSGDFWQIYSSDTTLGDNVWGHRCIVNDYTNSEILLYLDKVNIDNVSTVNYYNDINFAYLGFGHYIGSNGSVQRGSGSLDEVTFFNKALTQTEINEVYTDYDTWGLNTAPNTPSPTLISVDGTNNTNADLNCSATITDDDGDSMNVTVEWFNNSVSMGTYNLNNNYVNGTTVSNIFSSNNFSLSNIGDNIVCSMQSTDGSATSDWGNSTNLTLLESPPNPPTSIETTFLGEPLTATNPASTTFPINFSAIYSTPYSTDGNLVVCSNDALNYSSCNILCESDNVTSGSRASCEYTPTTGDFERIAYFFSHGSWSESSNTTYYVTSKSGDIPTTKVNSSPFFINTSLSATDENPYNFSCAANSVCTYTYVVQVSDIAGYGNYTIFAYDDNGNAEYNNETIEVS